VRDALGDRDEHPIVSAVAAQMRRPHAAPAGEVGIDHRLVERRPAAGEPPIAFGHRRGVLRDPRRVIGIDERAPQPERGPVVDKVDDRPDPKPGEMLEDAIGP
jgi:hypothetical protein